MTTLPKIALGAWAWGNDGTFGGELTADTLRPIFEAGMAHGLNLWDTAYAYGMGTSEAFSWTMGENGAPLIDEAKVSIECEVDGNYELEHFDHFVCKTLATYAEETVLNDKGKIDYHVFKPVLFEFPTYEYFVTGEKIGDCAKMNP